ncbi:MAG: type II CAAX prenyl endopeptidase Rce1 family protein [Terracidiphilus sp.]
MDGAADSARGKGQPGSERSRLRDWTEIGVAYGLILAVEWTPRPLQRAMWVVAAVGIAAIFLSSPDRWAAMGLRRANLGRSMWIVGAALALAGAAIAIAAGMHTLPEPEGPLEFVRTYAGYAVWTCVQQFLLQGFFLLRFLRVIPGERWAALAAAAMFAAAHAPNPVLMPATLLWGAAACLLFLRYRNLIPLMMAHAILGITMAITIPGPVDHNMRVGLGYLTYRPHMHAQHADRLPQP